MKSTVLSQYSDSFDAQVKLIDLGNGRYEVETATDIGGPGVNMEIDRQQFESLELAQSNFKKMIQMAMEVQCECLEE